MMFQFRGEVSPQCSSPKKPREEFGFTLAELLVVLAILSVFAGFAISYVAALKQRTFDSMAMQALRDGLTSQEAYYTSAQEYVPCLGAACSEVLPNLRIGETIHLGFRVARDEDGESLFGVSCSSRGSERGKHFFRFAKFGEGDQFVTVESSEQCSDDAVSELLESQWAP